MSRRTVGNDDREEMTAVTAKFTVSPEWFAHRECEGLADHSGVDDDRREYTQKKGCPPCCTNIVTQEAPLRWNGYSIIDFLDHDYLSVREGYDDWFERVRDGKMFGRSDMELVAFYWLKQRRDHTYQVTYPEWYYLLFWETHDYTLPSCFRRDPSYDEFETFSKTSDYPLMVDYTARRLSGCSYDYSKWITTAPETNVLSCDDGGMSLKESEWIKAYSLSPQQTLAYSFKASGYLDLLIENHRCDDKAAYIRSVLSLESIRKRMSGELPLISEDPWEARFMMSLLCRWMKKCPFGLRDSVLPRMFALLYLRFYRKGVDPTHMTRSRFRSDWERISFEEKESFAASCRGLLLETFRATYCCKGK